jgi:hypothetical protein
MANEPVNDGREIAVNDATIGEAIDQAFREALERHRQAGLPVVLYENEEIVWRDAGEVLAEMDAGRSAAE